MTHPLSDLKNPQNRVQVSTAAGQHWRMHGRHALIQRQDQKLWHLNSQSGSHCFDDPVIHALLYEVSTHFLCCLFRIKQNLMHLQKFDATMASHSVTSIQGPVQVHAALKLV